MGTRYLIDSNTIIDYLNGVLPQEGKSLLFKVEPIVSVITQIEVFGYNKLSYNDINRLDELMSNAIIYNLNQVIAQKTISIRLNYKIKLPDAVVAATALNYNLALITRNISDFKNIEGLEIINPHSI